MVAGFLFMDIETITLFLIRLMKENAIPVDDFQRMETYIYHAFNDERIKFVEQEGKIIGFMIWEVHKKEGDIQIYVSQLVILPQFKGFNLKELISFLRNKYEIKNSQIHWHSQKRNKQVDFNKKELVHEA